MRSEEYVRTLESRVATAEREVRRKDDLIRGLQRKIEALESCKPSTPEPDSAAIRLEVLNELDPVLKAKDERIAELERQLEAKVVAATNEERNAMRKEIEMEFRSELERRDRELEGLRNQISIKDAALAALDQNLDEKTMQAKNLGTTVKIHVKSKFGQNAETLRILAGRSEEDQRALEELSFEGKELEGMSQEEQDKLNEYHQSLEPQEETGHVADIKEEAMDELGLAPEPKKTPARRRPKPSSGLTRTLMQQIKNEVEAALGKNVNIKKIHFHMIDDEHPLPENAKPMLKADGTIDSNFSIVVTSTEPSFDVHVYQGARVKLDRDDIDVVGECGSERLELRGEVQCPLPRLTDKIFANPVYQNITQDNKEIIMDKKVFTTITGEPEEHRKAMNACLFDNNTLSFILREKYMYGSTFESIRDRIRDGGIEIPKSTFNENVHKFIGMLMSGLDQCFVDKVRKANCLNIDETCVLVATPVEKTDNKGKTIQTTEYKKKYMWVFADKEENTTYYRYEEDSRSQKVMLDVLGSGYSGTITTDGYSAYLIFDKDGGWSEAVLHTGCWTHARRYLVYMLLEEHDKAMELIRLIRDLFVYEAIMKKAEMTPERRSEYRKLHSIPIMNQIFQITEEYQKDPVLMAGERSRKAVNYLLSQRQPLQNFVLDGRAEISNNHAYPDKFLIPIFLLINSKQAFYLKFVRINIVTLSA